MQSLLAIKNAQNRIEVSPGRFLMPTPVYDTYWKFAAIRQDLFVRRLYNKQPWTEDSVLSIYRFTNAYRASDRVSQYLIRNVIYQGNQAPEEILFRVLLFKIFNKIPTWEYLVENLQFPSLELFNLKKFSKVLDRAKAEGHSIYSGAYIMPSPKMGSQSKHVNHLHLLEYILNSELSENILASKSLEDLYKNLLQCPSFGSFLAFQFAIDLNYSNTFNFSEMDFVIAGPGAKDGIRKCFKNSDEFSPEEIIRVVTERAPLEFARLGLKFRSLWGRPLQLIDCQNLFCEVDKYARVVHPAVSGKSGRTRIKQKYKLNASPIIQWYPPKWKVNTESLPALLKA